jgi:CBS domain-containing protein
MLATGHDKVQEWMTFPAITVSPTTSLRAAERLMKEYRIRHLPVLKDDKLVGILSSGDIRRASPSNTTSLSIWELQYLWDRVQVEEVMTRSVVAIRADAPVHDAVCLMLEHRFSSLPVLGSDGRLIGMLTETDLFHLLVQLFEGGIDSFAASTSDIQTAETS